MTDLLLRIIGVGDELSSHAGAGASQVQWLWHREVLLVLGLVLLVPLGYLIARRHRRSLPHVQPALRHLLTGCRVGVLLLLVLVLGGPYLRLDERVERRPVLAVIVDESPSMDLLAGPYEEGQMRRLASAGALQAPQEQAQEQTSADVPLTPEQRKQLETISRRELLQRMLQAQKASFVDPVTQRFDLRVYRVATQVREAALLQDEASEEEAAQDEGETALGLALERVLQDAPANQLAGIVLISDGHNTTGPDPLSVLQARFSGRDSGDVQNASGENDVSASFAQSLPVFTVPVGGAVAVDDIALLEVTAPRQLAQGDHASIIATVTSTGFAGRSVAVTLMEGGAVLAEETVALADGERQRVELTFEADEVGPRLLTVRAQEQPEESVKVNNEATVHLDVSRDRLALLYLEGTPRWDFRFLDHALRSDRGIEATIITQAELQAAVGADGEGAAAAARLPQDAAGWREFAVVMLGDVTPEFLPPRYQEQLARAVREDGVGLVVQAGPRGMPARFADQPLAPLLPVELDVHATQPVQDAATQGGAPLPALAMADSGRHAPAYAPFRMTVTAPGAIHPALQLYGSAAKNRAVWSQMPSFHWAAAVTEPRAGATVLAECTALGEPEPLIAEHFAGRGRVLFIGMDATFLWRRNIGSHLFYRFWGQAIRHAAQTPQRGGDKSWLEVYPQRLEPDGQVAIELYAVDEDGQPASGEQVTVHVGRFGSEQTQAVTLPRLEQAGLYRGYWHAQQQGNYRITYTDGSARALSAAVRVAGSGRELLEPDVDRDTLGRLADATGGQLVELEDLHLLPQMLEGGPTLVERTREADIWDNWLTLVLLVGLYCTDVGVRRVLGLT